MGYSRWDDEVIVFCNVGIAGRTGHDYPNRWDGKDLVWFGKTGSALHQSLIQQMVDGAVTVHVFWRGRNRAPFTYAGRAAASDVQDTVPVKIVWSFENRDRLNVDRPRQDDPGPIRSAAVAFRRGPAPAPGERTSAMLDGETSVYVMRLHGPVEALLPNLAPGAAVIKVGMSNAPERRLRELFSELGLDSGQSLAHR